MSNFEVFTPDGNQIGFGAWLTEIKCKVFDIGGDCLIYGIRTAGGNGIQFFTNHTHDPVSTGMITNGSSFKIVDVQGNFTSIANFV